MYSTVCGICILLFICPPLQMVWARACEVGCAVSVCRPEDIYGDAKPDADPRGNGKIGDGNDFVYMLVCIYGAGFPGNFNLFGRRPYLYGEPCIDCPNRFSSCTPSYKKPSPPQNLIIDAKNVVGKGEEFYNLCCKSYYNISSAQI